LSQNLQEQDPPLPKKRCHNDGFLTSKMNQDDYKIRFH